MTAWLHDCMMHHCIIDYFDSAQQTFVVAFCPCAYEVILSNAANWDTELYLTRFAAWFSQGRPWWQNSNCWRKLSIWLNSDFGYHIGTNPHQFFNFSTFGGNLKAFAAWPVYGKPYRCHGPSIKWQRLQSWCCFVCFLGEGLRKRNRQPSVYWAISILWNS